MKKIAVFVVVVSLVAVGIFTVAGDKNKEEKFFPLDKIKPGIEGYGLTDFGQGVVKFNVKALGVLYNALGVGHHLIAIEASDTPETGDILKRGGIYAGMSGSPVYFKDPASGEYLKAGSVSYGELYAKEPIGYLTPIESVVGVKDESEKLPTKVVPLPPSLVMRVPVALSCFGSQSRALVEKMFIDRGLNIHMISAGTAGAEASQGETKISLSDGDFIQDGSALGVALMTGDISIAAFGTVTHRQDEDVYLFGHPFIELGPSSYPMVNAKVLGVFPNYRDSSKIIVESENLIEGAFLQDRRGGLWGQLGKKAKLIPVKIVFSNHLNRIETMNFEVVDNIFLTPQLMVLGLAAAYESSERMVGPVTLFIEGTIDIGKEEPVRLHRAIATNYFPEGFFVQFLMPFAQILSNPFEQVEIAGANFRMLAYEERRELHIVDILIDKQIVISGEEVKFTLILGNPNGPPIKAVLPVKIAPDSPGGIIEVSINGGTIAERNVRVAEFRNQPVTLSEYIAEINDERRPDAIYITLNYPSPHHDANPKKESILPETVTKITKRNEQLTEEYEINVEGYFVQGSITRELRVIQKESRTPAEEIDKGPPKKKGKR